MRGVDLEFFEVASTSYLPAQLKVGALYFIQDTGVIRVNHGGGRIVNYGGIGGGGAVDPGQPSGGILPPENGGTGVDSLAKLKALLGIANDILLATNTSKNYTDTQISTLRAIVMALSQEILDLNYDEEIAALQLDIQVGLDAEEIARISGDESLRAQIEAVAGQLSYIPAYDFGTATPSKAVLDAYVKSQTGELTIENATSVVNLYDMTEWIYNATQDKWVSMGNAQVTTATNTMLGVVKGDAVTEGGIPVDAAGQLNVPVAGQTRRGAVRVKAKTTTPYTGLWGVNADSAGMVYVAGRTDNEAMALSGANNAGPANPFATLQDTANAALWWNSTEGHNLNPDDNDAAMAAMQTQINALTAKVEGMETHNEVTLSALQSFQKTLKVIDPQYDVANPTA